jgi:hypothetical protein
MMKSTGADHIANFLPTGFFRCMASAVQIINSARGNKMTEIMAIDSICRLWPITQGRDAQAKY